MQEQTKNIAYKFLLTLLALVVASVLALSAILASSLGPGLVAQAIVWIGSDPAAGTFVRVHEASGQVFGTLRFGRIDYGTGSTRLVEASGVSVRWHPLSLLEEKLSVDALTVERVTIWTGRSTQKPASGASSGTLPVDIDIRDIQVGALQLHGVDGDYQIRGHIAWVRQGEVDIDLNVSPQGPAGEALAVAVAYNPWEGFAEAALSLKTMPGGVLGRLLAPTVDDPVDVQLAGTGPVVRWRGTISASLAGTEIVVADLASQLRRGQVLVTALGHVETAPLARVFDQAPDLGRLQLQAETGFEDGLPGTYALELANSEFDLALSGAWRDGLNWGLPEFEIEVQHLSQSLRLQDIEAGHARLSGRLSKTRAGLAIEANGEVRPLQLAGLEINQIAGTFTGSVPEGQTWQMLGQGAFVLGAPLVKGGPAEGQWRFSVGAGTGLERITIEGASLHFGGLQAVAEGTVELPSALVSGKARIQMDAAAAQLYDLGRWTGGAISVVLEGVRDADTQSIDVLLEAPALAGSAQLVLSRGGVDAANAGIQVAGDYAFSRSGAIAIAPGLVLQSPQLKGIVRGPLLSPVVEANLALNALSLGARQIDEIEFTIEAANLAARPMAEWQGRFVHHGVEFASSGRISQRLPGAFDLADVRVTAEGFTLTGAAGKTGQNPWSAHIEVTAQQSPAWGLFLNQPAVATGSGSLDLKSGDAGLKVVAALDAADVYLSDATSRHILIENMSSSLEAMWDGSLRVNSFGLVINDLLSGNARVSELALEGRSLTGGDLMAMAALKLASPFDAAVQATLRLPGARLTQTGAFQLTGLSGHVMDESLSLDQPADFQFSADGLDIPILAGRLGAGRYQASYRQGPQSVVARARVEEISIVPVALFLAVPLHTGVLNATLDARLDANPHITLDAQLVDLVINGDASANPTTVQITGEASAKSLGLRGAMTGTYFRDLVFEGHLPLQWTQPGNLPTLDQAAPITTRVHGQMPIAPVWSLLGYYEHLLSGNLDIDIRLGGTLSKPEIGGALTGQNILYTHIVQKIYLAAPTLPIAVSDNRFVIDEVIFSDANNGRAAVSGWVAPLEAGGVGVNLEARLEGVHLLRRPDVRAQTTGTARFLKKQSDMRLLFELNIDQADIQLVDRAPPDYVPLEVTEINKPRHLDTKPAPRQSRARPIKLVGRIHADNRIFVRGRGLDSEWRGDVHLRGTLVDPVLNGTLVLNQGIFAFAGRDFDITSANLLFQGKAPVNPYLSARATHQFGDLSAYVDLKGPLSAPVLTLSSDPSMPTDEIVARILFGTSKDQLSALQAGQLALSVASLTGSGGNGLDVTGRIRRILSLDRLEIGTQGDNAGGMMVRGGKYITNNVYIDVGTEPGEESESSARVEVDLTKSLSVNSKVSTAGTTRFGVNWKHSY